MIALIILPTIGEASVPAIPRADLPLFPITAAFRPQHQSYRSDPEEEDKDLDYQAEDSGDGRGRREGVAFEVGGYQRVEGYAEGKDRGDDCWVSSISTGGLVKDERRRGEAKGRGGENTSDCESAIDVPPPSPIHARPTYNDKEADGDKKLG